VNTGSGSGSMDGGNYFQVGCFHFLFIHLHQFLIITPVTLFLCQRHEHYGLEFFLQYLGFLHSHHELCLYTIPLACSDSIPIFLPSHPFLSFQQHSTIERQAPLQPVSPQLLVDI